MKVIIIGSKGFIGSHLTTFYEDMEVNNVFGCDVVVDYAQENYFLIDAINANYQDIFKNNQFDLCINCSGAASVPDSLTNPLRDFTLNTYNVVKLLEAIRLGQSSCKFINLSSAAVYGNPAQIPIREEHVPKPISPYGIHKLQAEQICKMYFDIYKVPTCSLRIFSAYGNGLKKQLFWDVFKKASKGNVLDMFGTGDETRDFIHIDDVVRAIQITASHAGFTGEIVNIANGQEVKIKDAVETFLSFFKEQKSARFNSLVKEGDPLNWQADISNLQTMGYAPSVSLQKGLENYYLWVNQL